ncbi:MAG: hypothetical protein ACLGGX_08450 [Bdellovibrionia bacterium]
MKRLFLLASILMTTAICFAQSQPYCSKDFCANPALGDIKGFCINVSDDVWNEAGEELGPGYDGCYCPCHAYYGEDREKAKKNKK